VKLINVTSAAFKDADLTITWATQEGLERRDEIHPRAQERLLFALLTAPPIQHGKTAPRGPFVAGNLRVIQGSDGLLVLEVSLNPKTAIHIALPKPLPERLRELLEEARTWIQ